MWRFVRKLTCVGLLVMATGCATQDIPQAHRGQMFYRSGLLSLYQGGRGLDGPVLQSGTQFLGIYNELRLVDCSMSTRKESLDTLTKDGVHFGFDISVRFSAACSNESVKRTLDSMAPANGDTISPEQLYATFVRPAIGEAARDNISPVRANELNERQAEVMEAVRNEFLRLIKQRERSYVVVHEVNIKNLHFPESMDSANLERATQALLRDKAIAERERVTAEIETMSLRKALATAEAETIAVSIERVGAALARYPQYLTYDLQLKLPGIYRDAGVRGNMVIAAPNPLTLPQLQLPTPTRPAGRLTPE